MFSTSFILHPYPNKQGLHKVNIQVIYQRKKAYAPTSIKIEEKYFKDGVVIKHPNKSQINDILLEQKNDIEKRLLNAIRVDPDLTKEQLSILVKGEKIQRDYIVDFIGELETQLIGKLSPGRMRHYRVMAQKLNSFAPNVTFKEISITWLQTFEAWLRSKVSGNTVRTNICLLKGILSKAVVAGLIDEKQFKSYKPPAYDQKLANFLSEAEMAKFHDMVQLIDKPHYKLAGYYFLLACYAGYRISDLKAFNYASMVKDGNVILRTTKNGKIVSIPVHSRLQQVFDYIHDKPLRLSEQKVREYVKEIAGLIGIKAPKMHDGRHSFCMMLMANGFTIDEVAELIGDTPLIAKVYARVHNKTLNDKVMERLG